MKNTWHVYHEVRNGMGDVVRTLYVSDPIIVYPVNDHERREHRETMARAKQDQLLIKAMSHRQT